MGDIWRERDTNQLNSLSPWKIKFLWYSKRGIPALLPTSFLVITYYYYYYYIRYVLLVRLSFWLPMIERDKSSVSLNERVLACLCILSLKDGIRERQEIACVYGVYIYLSFNIYFLLSLSILPLLGVEFSETRHEIWRSHTELEKTATSKERPVYLVEM